MIFALISTTNNQGLRHFVFERGGSGPPRTTVVVTADMALVQKYEIPLQELPLRCLRLLQSGAAGPHDTIVFPEQAMIECAGLRKEAKELADQKRRSYRLAKPNPRGNA